MIKHFKCKETQKIYHRDFSKKFPNNIQRKAMRKLWMIDSSVEISDLKIPPSNMLEKFKGKNKRMYSIRINMQWRIRFIWVKGDVHDVEIIDYHK